MSIARRTARVCRDRTTGAPSQVQIAAVAITAAGVTRPAGPAAAPGRAAPAPRAAPAAASFVRVQRVSPRVRPQHTGGQAGPDRGQRPRRGATDIDEIGAFGPRQRRLLRVGTDAEQQRRGRRPAGLGLPEHSPSMARFVVCQ